MPAPIEVIKAKLKKKGKGYICPAHSDHNPSLSVNGGRDGRVLLKCHSGCTTASILQALELRSQDLFPLSRGKSRRIGVPPSINRGLELSGSDTLGSEVAKYDYTNENGEILYSVIRFSPKTFRNRGADGRWSIQRVKKVLYHLPEVIEGVALEKTIHLTEGEKDANALRSRGFIATTIAGGASAILTSEMAEPLCGASIVIHVDNDDPGRLCAQNRAAVLRNSGALVRIAEYNDLPKHGDVSDFIDRIDSVEALQDRIDTAVEWEPSDIVPNLAVRKYSLSTLFDNPELLSLPTAIIPRLVFQGRTTLIAAREKAGKSTFISNAASAVSRGNPFLGVPVTVGNVLHIALEEHLGDLVQRYKKTGADGSKIDIVDFLSDGINSLQYVLEEKNYSLVIIDTLSALLTACNVDDFNSAAKIIPIMSEITALARKYEVATALIHHASKSTGKYRDSTAIGGAVDMIAEMHAPDDKQGSRRDFAIKGRIRSEDFSVQYDGTRYSITSSEDSIEMRVIDFIRSSMIPQSKSAIRRNVTGGSGKIDSALRSLEERGLIKKDSDGYSSSSVGLTNPLDNSTDIESISDDVEGPPW